MFQKIMDAEIQANSNPFTAPQLPSTVDPRQQHQQTVHNVACGFVYEVLREVQERQQLQLTIHEPSPLIPLQSRTLRILEETRDSTRIGRVHEL